MHPNHIPKKFPWYQDRLVNQYDKTLHFGASEFPITYPKGIVFENYKGAFKPCPIFRKFSYRLAENCPQPKRDNSKTATDCRLYDIHCRSWRDLIDGKKALALALAIEEGT